MRYLIGIDDTDNLQTRGTGFRARQLGQELIQSGLANVFGISRHQLFFDPRVPYTSHNSSACLEVETGRFDYLKHYCSAFLAREAAPGSDAGLCIVAADGLSEEVIRWGARAKCELVTQAEAWTIAKEHGKMVLPIMPLKPLAGIMVRAPSIGMCNSLPKVMVVSKFHPNSSLVALILVLRILRCSTKLAMVIILMSQTLLLQ